MLETAALVLFILLVPAFFILLAFTLVGLVLSLVARLFGRRVALICALGLVAFIGYQWWSLVAGCNAPPIVTEPAPGTDGLGSTSFACDGPPGMVAAFLMFLGFPTAMASMLLVTWLVWRNHVRWEQRVAVRRASKTTLPSPNPHKE